MNYKLNDKIEYTGNTIHDILKSRGIENPEEYLHPSREALLDPLLLDNMDGGAELLLKHLKANNKIYLQSDCDVDGITSASVIWLYLKRIFPDCDLYFGMHDGKQHGIDLSRIEENTSLVICPDAGSNSPEISKELHDNGIETLVIDHHESDTKDDYAIIINNQMSEDYPNKTLSGAGVVYKFIQYLDAILGVSYADDYLDLVTLGIVADLMDLRNIETRYILNKGLNNIKNPGFKLWLKKQEFSLKDTNHLTPEGYSYYIAPLVNAIVRVGTDQEKECLFLSFIDGTRLMPSTKRGAKTGDMEICAEQAFRYGTNCRNRQNKILEEAVKYFDMKIEMENLNENKILFLRLDDDEALKIPSELTGLLAMRLVAKYNKPAIVTRLNSNNEWVGSLRGLNDNAFDNFKEFLNNSNLVNYASGHANAAGISISDKNVDKLLNYSNEVLTGYDFGSSFFKVDFIFTNDNIDKLSKVVLDIGKYKNLWGQMVEQPKIAIENLDFSADDVEIVGSGTTGKITVAGVTFIKFKDSKFINDISFMDYGKITLIGTPQINSWMGRETSQILIDDYEIKDNGREF